MTQVQLILPLPPDGNYRDFVAILDAVDFKSLPIETLQLIGDAEREWHWWFAENARDPETRLMAEAALVRSDELRERIRQMAKAEIARRGLQ